MSCFQQNLDQVELRQTLEFFKAMGFSDRYMEHIEKELQFSEPRYARTILANLMRV